MTVAFVALGLGIASAVVSVFYGLFLCWREPSDLRSALKTFPVAVLALVGWLVGAPWLIVAGLALGAAGDWFLSRKGEAAFLAGMAVFALGHLAYAVHFAHGKIWVHTLYGGVGLLALAISTEFWLAPHTGSLRWPVRGYVLVICAMALAALTLGPEGRVMLIGAAMFVLSDLLLSVELFVSKGPRRRALSQAVWGFYWGGQALILLGSLGPSISRL